MGESVKIHQDITQGDLDLKLNIVDYNDYTTAGLVTENRVINNINGIITMTEVLGYYDTGNVAQALTLKTFDTASAVNPHHIRPSNWRTEVIGIDIMTTNSSVAAGNQPLTIGMYEIARTGGVRGFQTGTLKHQTTIVAPLTSQFYRGEYQDFSSAPILLTPNFLLFVDVRHFGGWNYDNLYYKVYVKYTKI
jgi:hypothetical protein